MLSEINTLTTESKLSIVNLLRTPKIPEDIANSLKITRQAVDKQLKELVKFGIAERRWFIGYNRPKIEYLLTDLGKMFYSDLEKFTKKFREEGRITLNDRLKSLDLDLISGKLTVNRYSEERTILKESMKWFSGMD